MPLIHASILFLKNFKWKDAFCILLIVALTFSPGLIFQANDPISLTNNRFASEWSFYNLFRNDFITADGHLSYFFPNILFILSNLVYPGFIFPGIIFLIYFIIFNTRFPYKKIVFPMILIYAIFIAGLPLQNQRYLLLTFPMVLFFFYFSFSGLLETIRKYSRVILLILFGFTLAIQLLLCYRAFKPFFGNSSAIRYVTEKMKKYPGKTIYTFNIDMALQSYQIENEMINLWINRIDSFKPGSLVLVDRKNIVEHWQGMNPMINWESLNKNYPVRLIETMPGGWELYEIGQ